MYCRKIISLLFCVFSIFSLINGTYWDGIVSKNVFVTSNSIILNGKNIDFKKLHSFNYRNIFFVNGKILLVDVHTIFLLNFEGEVQQKKYVQGIINASFLKNNIPFILIKNTLYKLNIDDFSLRKIKSNINHYYFFNNRVKEFSKKVRLTKDNKLFYLNNRTFYFPQSIKKIFLYNGGFVFFIDINGDLFEGENLLIKGESINFVKREGDNFYFFGQGIFNEKGIKIKDDFKELNGYIYRVFENNSDILISTYDAGIFILAHNKFSNPYPFKLLSGIKGDLYFFRNGDVFNRKNIHYHINDEILTVMGDLLFCKNGIYSFNEKKYFIKQKSFYFSAMDIGKKLIGSYKKGLFLYKKGLLKHVKTPFRGVKNFIKFENKFYIITNDGLYEMKNKLFNKIIDDSINDAFIRDNRLYFSPHNKGIYYMKNGEIRKTSLSKEHINAYFLKNQIVIEVFHNIYLIDYEIL